MMLYFFTIKKLQPFFNASDKLVLSEISEIIYFVKGENYVFERFKKFC